MAGQVIPAPYRITEHDKGGLIVVTAALTMCFVWVCFFIRLWLRSKTREWKSDDWWLTVATLLQTSQSALVFHAVNLGLGAPQTGVSSSALEELGREGLTSQILFASTLFATKCSVLFLYLRISPGGTHKIASCTMLAASVVWVIIAITLIAAPCNQIGWNTARNTCTNLWPKWQAIASLDIATEVCIFGIAVLLVWSLNMRTSSKLLVVLAFSARLPVIALAAIRLHFVKKTFVYGDTTFIYLVATQWQMGYATMSSTITGIGPFLRPFNKEYTTSYITKSAYARHELSRDPHGPSNQGSQLHTRKSWSRQSYQLSQLNRPRRNSAMDLSGSTARSPRPPPLTSRSSDSSHHAPLSQASDPTFRPADEMLICGTEIWVGNRMSRDEEDMDAMSDETRLVIKKRTELTVETDRASRVT